jgi:hypothetical protein
MINQRVRGISFERTSGVNMRELKGRRRTRAHRNAVTTYVSTKRGISREKIASASSNDVAPLVISINTRGTIFASRGRNVRGARRSRGRLMYKEG